MDERSEHRRSGGARRRAHGHSSARPPRPGRRLAGAALLALVVLSVLGIRVAVEVSTAAGQSGLVRVGAAPRLPRGAVDLGPAPAAATVSGALLVRPRDAAALQSFLGEVTSKGSPLFGHYLSKGQFAERFGPTAATVAAARAQLENDGLHVGAVTGNGLLVRFSGSA